MIRYLLCSGFLCSLVVATSATSHFIEPDGSGDYPTIQNAIYMAAVGDTIMLANGTYRGAYNRDLDFNGRDLIVCSANDDPALCIIDCEGTEADMHRGFNFQASEGPTAIVRGITITGGLQAGC